MSLFSKNKTDPVPISGGRSDHETAFFGSKLIVKGKVSGNGNLIIMGKLEGEFDLNGELVIAPSAAVSAEIKALTLTVSGNVTGNLTAREKISLEKSAVVSGSLAAPRLSMVEGASFNGQIEMKKPPEGTQKPKTSDKK
jgi:cytoskeletal protein CcmA (bactofilin family)